MRPVVLLLAGLLFRGLAYAQELVIPADELVRPPSAERVADLVERAGRSGWGSLTEPLRAAAFAVYERDPAAAGPWYGLYRWADLLATPQAKAVERWIKAVEAARVGHPNMPTQYALPPGSLAALVGPDFLRTVLADASFSEEFFATLTPVDNPLEVLRILQRLHAAGPALFADYERLALAIAVVYDVPPPPTWPHGQVSAVRLPRRLPDALEAFQHWTRLDRANVSAQRLRRLPSAELKFVVDAAAPLGELTWAQRNVTPPLSELAQAYTMVKYREDRLRDGRYVWPGPDYRLESILRDGGICVDQAYFAVHAGKARGVPTLFFRGAGLDGRHAWFGFLDANQKWHLDAGRYAEQQFVTGLVFDPQTWRDLTDHELVFLSDRFRQLPLYKLSAVHAAFAAEYLRRYQPGPALRAAREAVNRERRNLEAWRVLLDAQRAAGEPARGVEGTLREAALAFQKQPDLEIEFSRQLVASLRQRGETSVAAAEEQRLMKKYAATRSDLSLVTAAAMLERSLQQEDLAGQMRTYQRLLETQGRGANIDFYDKVVRGFVGHLAARGEVLAARQALERARRSLRVEPGGQLDRELREAEAALRSPRS